MKRPFKLATILLIIMVSSFFSLQLNQAVFAQPSTVASGPTDPNEFGAWLESTMEILGEFHIAGATVSVVKDGQLFFAKGYGYADVELNKPVVATETLFRVASLTKLFTWTAIMQLVEEGKLDLNADVNKYLKNFQIHKTFPQPITVANLMTHTEGFEINEANQIVYDPAQVVSIESYVANHIPTRVRPPGEIASYFQLWGSACRIHH